MRAFFFGTLTRFTLTFGPVGVKTGASLIVSVTVAESVGPADSGMVSSGKIARASQRLKLSPHGIFPLLAPFWRQFDREHAVPIPKIPD